MDWPVVIVVALTLVLLYVWWLSRRIARLTARTRAALDALEEQLGRRAEAAAELPGVHEVAKAALTSGRPDSDARQGAENDLVRELRHLGADALEAPALLAENRRLVVARQVYNDAVRDTRSLRTARIPRTFWLARRRPLPQYFDVDELDLDAVDHERREQEALRRAAEDVGRATTGQS
ncbi:hypothetical protein [Cryptosporangium aurantiacum]|uniref:LemA protein n=1 Tax=Cryptosporangium aurantiacum TaxID=134849 RepID=A0A1M7RFL2_9ACTN|nr:hypothetical protein [Cryptosporangium aurantiacum]SHN45063.1 hypothetical protein SAMN05443668_11199 [Cryptosporangium aurantiacum]